jgi:hypothetical protein
LLSDILLPRMIFSRDVGNRRSLAGVPRRYEPVVLHRSDENDQLVEVDDEVASSIGRSLLALAARERARKAA